MTNFLSGNLSNAQLEEMRWKALEQKLETSQLNQINVPYEKEKLRGEIEAFENKISKQVTLTMKTCKQNQDPILRHLKLKQHRLQRIMNKIVGFEETINNKMKMELEMQEQELSNQENMLKDENEFMIT